MRNRFIMYLFYGNNGESGFNIMAKTQGVGYDAL